MELLNYSVRQKDYPCMYNSEPLKLVCLMNYLYQSSQIRVLPSRETQWNEPYYGFPWLRRNPSFSLFDDFGCLDL